MKKIIETNIINVKDKINSILISIKNIWNNIWNGIKTATSNIWNAIYNAIKKPINWILSGVEKMANGVVTGVNKVINSLNRLHFKMPDWLGGGSFGINIPTMNYVTLPRLAKGNVAYSETMAIFGEYSGASNNPEITTPQNIMAETFRDVLSDYEFNDNGTTPINIAIYVGNKKLGDILLDNLRDKRRQTGQGIEALVGG